MYNQSDIILITGVRQIGKTTLCQHVVADLQAANLTVSGLLTQHTGSHSLRAMDVVSGKTFDLTLPFEQTGGVKLKHFRMDPVAMAQSAEAVRASFPTQVFFLDELGPLELKKGQGWRLVIDLLKDAEYRIAFIVVRPELLVEAIYQLPAEIYPVVNVKMENRAALPERLCRLAMTACEE
jgi:nucleoside-triphosphatase THEP1